MHPSIYYLFTLFLVVKWAYSIFNREQVEKAEQKRLEYIVNNNKIPCTFERYYYIKLGLPLPILKIDLDVVERQYERKVQDAEIGTVQYQEVEAANKYFIDRLNYLSHLN